jgi:hypothetical protein
MILPVGAFVEGELYPSWMQFFPSPFLPLFFSLFTFSSSFSFFFTQGLTRGHCLGVVTRADSVTHKYLHRDDKASS